MDNNCKSHFVRCDCGCCWMVFERVEWEDGDVDFNVSVVDSRYDHKANGLLNRIKRAAGALLGKPVHFNDVYIQDPARFGELVDALQAMRVDETDE